MNQDFWISLIRRALTALGGYLVARGMIATNPTEQWTTETAAVLVWIGTTIWAQWHQKAMKSTACESAQKEKSQNEDIENGR